jgi:uncharacterized protein YcfJ
LLTEAVTQLSNDTKRYKILVNIALYASLFSPGGAANRGLAMQERPMNRLLLSSMVLLGIATNAYAFESVARVVNTAPIVETVNHPTQNCWTEYQPSAQYHPPEHSYGGAVVGGIAGGLLGSRFGEGNGRVLPRQSGRPLALSPATASTTATEVSTRRRRRRRCDAARASTTMRRAPAGTV